MCTIDEKAAVHSADHAGADAPHTHATACYFLI